MEIVPVNAENACDFGQVIYDAWGETYRGLIPDEVLDGRSLERWTEMAKVRPEGKRIAYIEGEAAGIVALLPLSREFCTHRDSGEIVALYVLKKFQRQGVGKALLETALRELEAEKVTLFVLKGNDNAVGFYKRMGFEFTGKQLNEGGMTELEMVRQERVLAPDGR